MTYALRFSGRAEREFLKLSPAIAERVSEAVLNLKDNPRPSSCVKLTGSKSEYRIRIGDYRILYEITGETVTVYRIRHRKEAYR